MYACRLGRYLGKPLFVQSISARSSLVGWSACRPTLENTEYNITRRVTTRLADEVAFKQLGGEIPGIRVHSSTHVLIRITNTHNP